MRNFISVVLVLAGCSSGDTVIRAEGEACLVHHSTCVQDYVCASTCEGEPCGACVIDDRFVFEGTQLGDPDRDDLDDSYEQIAGTDPLIADTDGDGVSDGDEYWGGDEAHDMDGDGIIDPLDPDTAPAVRHPQP